MKKFILILISIFLLSSSFIFGFFVKKSIDDKKYSSWETERKNLKDQIKFLEDLNAKLTNSDNPIDQKTKECIKKTTNSTDVRSCVYVATEEWEKEINKYLLLLKESTTSEQYKLIKASQNAWINQKQNDNNIINEFVFNHGGTLYYDLAAGDYEEIIKNRAEFLKWIYDVHTDKITDIH